MHVGADEDEQIGAVARLGQRRHDPATALHDGEVAELSLAQRVVDDAPGMIGDCQDGADAVDVGGESAVKGKVGLGDETGGGLDGIFLGDRLALEAELGYNLLIGNAGGLSLTLNGEPVKVLGRSGQVVTIQIP